MPVPTDHLAEEIKQQVAGLNARIDRVESAIHDVNAQLAAFRERTGTQMDMAKWLGMFFAGLLATLIIGAVGVSWRAGIVANKVDNQAVVVDGLATEMKGMAQRMGRMEGRLDGVEKRLDKIDGRLDGMDQRLGAVEKRQERMFGQLDGIAKQLDVIIQRAGK